MTDVDNLDGADPNLFWPKVDRRGPDECWPWTAAVNAAGYGLVSVKRRSTLAHRVSWYLNKGRIPTGEHVLHRCDNPPCVNPAHLFLGTPATNAADREGKGRGNQPVGRNNKGARRKLTPEDVVAIRAADIGCNRLSREYGVSPSAIKRIRSGKNWRHVP